VVLGRHFASEYEGAQPKEARACRAFEDSASADRLVKAAKMHAQSESPPRMWACRRVWRNPCKGGTWHESMGRIYVFEPLTNDVAEIPTRRCERARRANAAEAAVCPPPRASAGCATRTPLKHPAFSSSPLPRRGAALPSNCL
jgi:hypothetical protein